MQHHTAEAAAARMLAAQDRLEAYRAAQWTQRSWLSKVLWILFQ